MFVTLSFLHSTTVLALKLILCGSYKYSGNAIVCGRDDNDIERMGGDVVVSFIMFNNFSCNSAVIRTTKVLLKP